MKTKLPLFCGLIAVVSVLILTACLSLTGGTRAHTHQWSEWTQASGDDATEERVCKIDSTHIQTRLTGTDRFHFWEIGETAYGISYSALTTSEVIIPAYYRPDVGSEYLPVTEIGSMYNVSSDVGRFFSPNITISEGVTSIGAYAFSHCDNLTSITIPSSVTFIGIYAFSRCDNLTNITIPPSVTFIGEEAFSYCYRLTGITVEAGNPNYASEGGILYDKVKTTLIQAPQGKSGHVSLPASVTTIDDMAFYNCGNLTSLTFPTRLTSIGRFAFWGCTGLTSITFHTGLTSIGESAFSECASLASITIPESVTSIGWDAFGNTTWGNGQTTAWLNNQPDGLVYAGKVLYTYKGTWSADIVINNIRADTIAIADAAFTGRDITSITIPAGVRYIGNNAFSNCYSLTSITIPASVTSIGYEAFSNCKNFTSIIIPETLTTIGNGAFAECEKLTNIIVDANNPNYTSEDGMLFNKTKTEILAYPSARGNITIPASVTSIRAAAFFKCTNLTSITIPASVTSVGVVAFYRCTSLTNITIPSSVMSVGIAAFGSWNDSQTINIPFANREAVEVAWGSDWRDECNAQINYLGH